MESNIHCLLVPLAGPAFSLAMANDGMPGPHVFLMQTMNELLGPMIRLSALLVWMSGT